MMRRRFSLFLIASALLLIASPAGLAQTACATSLQAQIDAAPAGSTLVPQPCIYREYVRVTKPLVIDGQGVAEIRGSDVWTQWTQQGSNWVSTLSVPPSKPDSPDAVYTDKPRAIEAAQVFLDGQPSTFTLDSGRHVVLASNPAGHIVEVSTRDRWLSPQADGITVTRMTLRHALTMAQDFAIGSEDHAGFTLRDSVISDTHGTAISPSGSDSQVLNNTIQRIGSTALISWQDRNTIVKGNAISQAGIGGWDWGWQGGAVKLNQSSNLVVEGNTARDNVGPGLWCDIGCSGVQIRNNVVSGNTGPGILYEISSGAVISSNRISSDSDYWPALYVSSSSSVEVAGNTIQAGRGLQAYEDGRAPVTDVYLHDNAIVATAQSSISTYMGGGALTSQTSNRGANNHYWYPAAEDGQTRFVYGTAFSSLQAFSTTPGGQGARYMSDAEKAQALGTAAPTPLPTPALRVSGNRLLDANGKVVVLHGVNRSGTEYMCSGGSASAFDGPSDQASIDAIKAWNVNAVRVPLNEGCWLGINGIPQAMSAATYRSQITGWVNLLTGSGLYVIVDLHWSAPGAQPSTSAQPMPDADHSPAFWDSVARGFASNPMVLYDLHNEPYPDSNQASSAAWACLRDGGTCPGVGFQAAGMQSLVNTVRATGATNVIMVAGVQYSNALGQWLTYKPSDPLNNLAASWHSYNFNACNNATCWQNTIAPVMASVPLIAGEFGEGDCAHGYIDTLMPWLDSRSGSYLAWAWNTYDCGGFPSLISNYSGTPTNYGIGVRDHYLGLAGTPPTPSPTFTATVTPTPTLTLTLTATPTVTATPTPCKPRGHSGKCF